MFTPRYIKHSRLLIRHAEKLVRYRKDVLSDSDLAEFKKDDRSKVKKAIKARDEETTKAESEHAPQALHDAHASSEGCGLA